MPPPRCQTAQGTLTCAQPGRCQSQQGDTCGSLVAARDSGQQDVPRRCSCRAQSRLGQGSGGCTDPKRSCRGRGSTEPSQPPVMSQSLGHIPQCQRCPRGRARLWQELGTAGDGAGPGDGAGGQQEVPGMLQGCCRTISPGSLTNKELQSQMDPKWSLQHPRNFAEKSSSSLPGNPAPDWGCLEGGAAPGIPQSHRAVPVPTWVTVCPWVLPLL